MKWAVEVITVQGCNDNHYSNDNHSTVVMIFAIPISTRCKLNAVQTSLSPADSFALTFREAACRGNLGEKEYLPPVDALVLNSSHRASSPKSHWEHSKKIAPGFVHTCLRALKFECIPRAIPCASSH